MPHQPNPQQNPTVRSGRQSSRPVRQPKVAGLRLRSSAAKQVSVERPEETSVLEADVVHTHVPAVEDARVPTADKGATRSDAAEIEEVGEKPAAAEVSTADEAKAEEAAEVKAAGKTPAGQGAGWWTAVRRGPTRLLGRYTVPVALVLLTAVFAGLSVWFGSAADHLRSGGAAQNKALADPVVTSEVVGQVTTGVQTLFSYDFNNMDKTATAAKDMLVGKAIGQYQQLYDQVRVQAPQQKLVVTMTVKSVGVKLLQGDKADVLVFGDQTVVHTDTNQSEVRPAQFSVAVQRANGHWRLADFTLY